LRDRFRRLFGLADNQRTTVVEILL